jgi:hypothetical protein
MPRGDKSRYTDKQERKADHIADGYRKRGIGSAPATPPLTGAVVLAVKHPRRDLRQRVRHRPRRRPPRASDAETSASAQPPPRHQS